MSKPQTERIDDARMAALVHTIRRLMAQLQEELKAAERDTKQVGKPRLIA